MLTDLLVDALAVKRLTRLVVEDEIAAPLRDRIFDRWPPRKDRWSYALTCPHCASVWIAGGVTLARTLAPRQWRPVGYALAAAGAVSLVYELTAEM